MTEAMGVDLHTHIIPHVLPGYAGLLGERRWPCVEEGDCGHRHVVIEGKNFRTFTSSAWDAAQRLSDMKAMQVGRQVLSPMPELLSYWFDARDTQRLARYVNGYMADMVSQQPDHFLGFGMVPLQDPDLAARELEAIKALGLSGVEIGTNICGKPIGDPFFAPFFSAAEALDMPIFVHALHAAGTDRLVGPKGLEQIVAFPCETGLAIASLMTGGMLERHPGLRLAFSHGGGAFGLMLPRLAHIWTISDALKAAMTRSPFELARTLFYDTLVYDAETLRFLMGQFGSSQLIIGSDYPFSIYERRPLDAIAELDLSDEVRESLRNGNVARFLGLTGTGCDRTFDSARQTPDM